MALVAVVASLCVVFATPTTANAAIPPLPVTVATTLAAPGTLGGAGTTAGVCAATVACGVLVGGTLLITGLYLTHDSWLPVLGDFFTKAGKLIGIGNSGCAVDFNPVIGGNGQLTFYYSWTGCPARSGVDEFDFHRIEVAGRIQHHVGLG